jgi:hypothetical protein
MPLRGLCVGCTIEPNNHRTGRELDIPTINGQQFATKFALRSNKYAWFLGAGASAGGGIPTGYDMIRDFKIKLFCQKNKLPRREVDPADPLWVARIDDFFKLHNILPPVGDPSEYARAFEAVYPDPADRRAYIDTQVKAGRPSFAHRVLACLLTTNNTPCVFTTNFDALVETATTVAGQLLDASEGKTLTVAAIDNSERASRCLRESDWPLLAKIHGDFQSIELKNTGDELASQNEKMRSVMVETCGRFGLVVVGYSGRDASVMQALSEAITKANPFPGGIYWITRSSTELSPAVQDFLKAASVAGVSAHIVESQNFDELAGDLADAISFDARLEKHIREGQIKPMARPLPMPTHEALTTPILRCSALRIFSLPKVARRIRLQKAANIVEIRRCLKEAKVKACIAVAGNDYAAFGPDEELLAALASYGPTLAGTIELDPIANSWALGLLYDALTRSLCKGRPLNPRLHGKGHEIVVSHGHPKEDEQQKNRRLHDLEPLVLAYGVPVLGKLPKLGYPFNEGLRIRLEQCAGHWWCVFDPFTHVQLPQEARLTPDAVESASDTVGSRPWKPNPAADWIRERWVQRYNAKWSYIIGAWSSLLAGSDGKLRAFWLKEGEGIDAAFDISSVTAWSKPSHDHAYFHRRG